MRHFYKGIISFKLTLSLPNVAKGTFRPNFQISFSKILRNKLHHAKVQTESFHLNHRISSTDSEVRVTLQNSIKHSGSERVKVSISGEILARLDALAVGGLQIIVISHVADPSPF